MSVLPNWRCSIRFLVCSRGHAAVSHGIRYHLARNLAQQPLVLFRGCSGWNSRHDPVVGEGRDRLAVGMVSPAVVSRAGAVLYLANALADQVAHHDDAAVGRGEMLEPVAGGAAMNADLCVVVAWDPLAFLVRSVAVLAEPVARPHLATFRGAAEADLHRVGIVERHRPGR